MIVPIRQPLVGAVAERFLVLAPSLIRTLTTDELERQRLLGAELRWAKGASALSTRERDANEAAIRVLADLHRFG